MSGSTKEVASLLIVQNFTMLESRGYTSHSLDVPMDREQEEIGSMEETWVPWNR
jgi:hypothetical protein